METLMSVADARRWSAADPAAEVNTQFTVAWDFYLKIEQSCWLLVQLWHKKISVCY